MNKRLKIILIITASVCLTLTSAVLIYVFQDFFFGKTPTEEILFEGGIALHFIDVGQGDCTLVMTPEGNMLIDAGTSSSEDALKAYLEEQDVKGFEYLVLTHPHDDHIGGADMILRNYNVENVIMTQARDDSALYDELMSLIDERDVNIIYSSSGYEFDLYGCKNTIIAPNKPVEDYTEPNAVSIVLKCEFEDFSFIVTGDAEADSENEMIDEFGDFLDCDILKLGHHGSKTSSSYNFLKITSPEYAIACCGKDNTYGHPSAEVMYRLDLFEIDLLRTDKEGSLVFVSDGESFKYTENN